MKKIYFAFALKYEETSSPIQCLKRCKLDVDKEHKKKLGRYKNVDTKTTKTHKLIDLMAFLTYFYFKVLNHFLQNAGAY